MDCQIKKNVGMLGSDLDVEAAKKESADLQNVTIGGGG